MYKTSHTRRHRNPPSGSVVVGIDTHLDIHRAALVDAATGAPVADQQFPATPAGYLELLDWAVGHGRVSRAGVEQTGTYGAGLSAVLHAAGIEVIEINHTERGDRARHGKTDELDAYRAATAAAAGTQKGLAKHYHPAIAALRPLMVLRAHHRSSRQRAWGRVGGMLVTCPDDLADQVRGLNSAQKLARIAAWRPDLTRLHDPVNSYKLALRDLARACLDHDRAIVEIDAQLLRILTPIAPTLLAQHHVGPVTTAQLLITAGHPGRITSGDAFAKLVGVAPLPVQSGKSSRWRLSRSGDRQANSVIHRVVIGRLGTDPRSKTYIQRRVSEGKTRSEAIRALKRHVTRDLWTALQTDLNNLPHTT
ncbi:hypothetical protein RPIT_06635 [Tessaracoccus flavus]|uniref:Uncharacterized protein n=1 Tax=Tessaracoccus flavus TaxID=1610493 RepID=A0A1Q2CEJ7_9ACTN|nr:IS110 family transposase [Tessaracoccus flavus]AQP44528.1 hypothetical protein RPIT_06635 [Tessaracoccus flavus]